MNKKYHHDETDENSRVRAERRQVRRDSQARDSTRSRRGRERHLSVRSELRDKPDVSKIARAVIRMTLAQAEVDAAKQAAQRDGHAAARDQDEDGPDA